VRTRSLELRRPLRSRVAWRRTDLDHPSGEWRTGGSLWHCFVSID
jgi:hypothetical protein